VIHPPILFLHDNLSFTGSKKTIRTGAVLLLTHRTSSPGLTETSAADKLSPMMTSFTSPVLVTVGVLSQPPINSNAAMPMPKTLIEVMGYSSKLHCGLAHPCSHNTAYTLQESGDLSNTDQSPEKGARSTLTCSTSLCMVQVRMTDGALTVWWPNIDQPVAKLT